jgi:uncharacterized protein YndB with AHSA1/START domain
MRVYANIVIHRPIAAVFSFLCTPSYLRCWVAGVASADGPTPLEQGIGQTFSVQATARPDAARSTWEVTTYEPPRMLALRSLDDARAVEVRWTLESGPPGATRVSVEADLTAVSFFPPEPIHLNELGARQLEADLEVLRTRLEADTQRGSR